MSTFVNHDGQSNFFLIFMGVCMNTISRWGRKRNHPIVGYWPYLCLCLVLSGMYSGSAESFTGHGVGSIGNGNHWRDASALDPNVLNKVGHDPGGPTLNHDYYERRTNKGIHELVLLVENAHVNEILPNLRKSFTAPENLRQGFLNQALKEINYTLGRLVNHPKALALSASVTKLLGKPRMPIIFYQRAIKMYPHRAFTQAQFGNFLVGLGEIDQGIERLKTAIKLNPKLAMSYGWLAWAYQKKGDLDLAAEYSKEAKKRGFKGKLPKVRPKK